MKARISGIVRFDNSGAADAFSLEGDASGGAGGIEKGGANVTIVETEGKTSSSTSHVPRLAAKWRSSGAG